MNPDGQSKRPSGLAGRSFQQLSELVLRLDEQTRSRFDEGSKEVRDAERVRFQLPIEDVQDALNSMDVRVFSYVGHGGSSLVLEHGRHQVARICLRAREYAKRPNLPCVLQALETFAGSDVFFIEILPRLLTGATMEHAFHLAVELAKADHLFMDAYPNNVGLLPDGTPLVLDPGLLMPATEILRHEREQLRALKQERAGPFFWVEHDGTWKQSRLAGTG